MDMELDIDQLFGNRINYPDFEFKERLDSLIGLDDHKMRLKKIISLLVNPFRLQEWMKKHHSNASDILNFVLKRPPLIVLEGDVGSGKTELAETIGDAVARGENINITLFPLSLSTRGQGRVGEMTQLLSSAFNIVISEAKKFKNSDGPSQGAIIFLIDEADALAQSREFSQMHHEDRAGVNAFIRGIDHAGHGRLPIAVIMCTNRHGALDPAIKRRAADILTFKRPDKVHRYAVLKTPLKQLGFSDQHIKEIVALTGSSNGRDYGFTYSDLTQRLLPRIVIDAFPDKPIDPIHAVKIAQKIVPTPPFQEDSI